jgi:hypothetical protein
MQEQQEEVLGEESRAAGLFFQPTLAFLRTASTAA